MKKTADGEPQMAIMATLGTELYTKYVIVVDDDVDIFDMNDVMWAVATRVRAEKDIFFIPGAKGAILDPTSDPETFTVTKMGIDATRPAGRDFAERLVISDEQRARARSLLEAAGVKPLIRGITRQFQCPSRREAIHSGIHDISSVRQLSAWSGTVSSATDQVCAHRGAIAGGGPLCAWSPL